MRHVQVIGLVIAGAAALFAPAPWWWIGAGGAVLGLTLGVHTIRQEHAETAELEDRAGDLAEAVESIEREDHLHMALLSVLPTGVVAFREGTAVYANPAAVDMLGDRFIGEGGPLPPDVRSVVERAAAGFESVGLMEEGFPARMLELVATPPDRSGVSVLRLTDVTDRTQVDAMRRDFVAAASHELKTPAAAIQAAAETVLMALDDDPEAVRDFTARIHANASRLSRIVTDLLDLSRLEAGQTETEAVDIAGLAIEEVGRFEGSEPSVRINAAGAIVEGNRSDLSLALRNLLDNAVRYTPPTGRVDVEVVAGADAVAISVTDDGPGIPIADVPRVFERFYRVDDARSRATGGTGLGLAIVKHVAELHGGTVAVESEVGVGSTFTVTLPIADRANS